MKCKNCEIKDAVKYSKYSSGQFCSKSCAASFSTKEKRDDINKRVSMKLLGKKRGHEPVDINCHFCNKTLKVIWKKRKQKYCSISCSKTDYMNQKGVASEMGKKSVQAQSNSRRSKNEIYFSELCRQKFKLIRMNDPMFNGWDADIIIEDIKVAVLWNGKWHYEKIKEKHSVEQVQKRDQIKLKEIEKAGYKSYVIKDMGKYNKKFVENKFKEMFDFLKL
jgi:hypothetical protein